MIDPNDIEFTKPVTDENGTTRIKAVHTVEATYEYIIDPKLESEIDYEQEVKEILVDAIIGHFKK